MKEIKKELLTMLATIMFALAANMIISTFGYGNLDSVDKGLMLFLSACFALLSVISSAFHVFEQAGSEMLYELKAESPLIEMVIKTRSLFLASAICLLPTVHFLTVPCFIAVFMLIGLGLLFIKSGR